MRVSVEALPDLPPPEIGGIKLERLTVEADDAAVDAQIEQLASSTKNWVDAPEGHAAGTGDSVVIDFVGTVAGKEFEGGKGEDMAVEIGSGRLIPGFEDQLIGAKVGESRDLNVTFPADYPAADLKGKDAVFAVTVKAVKVAGERTIDEDFAKSLGLQSLDQLRTVIRDQQAQELNGLTRTHMKRQLLDQLAERHDFAVPVSMVEAEYQNILRQLRHEAGHESDPDAALAEIEKDGPEYRKIAERRVRLGLLLSEIGAANGVAVTEQEMNRLIAQAASQYQGKDRENFIRYIQQEPMAAAQLRAPLYEDKVVDFLFEKAEITESKGTREQLEADLESEEGHVHGPDCGHDHGAPAAAKPAKAKGKKAAGKAEEAPAPEQTAGDKVGTKPAKAAKGKPAADKAKLTEDASAEPKPAKPLKSEPANKAAAKAVGDSEPKAKKAPAKKK